MKGQPMIPKKNVEKLIKAHLKLEDRMTGAIWIRQNDNQAWIVEVIPAMANDEKVASPIHFNPGISFRYPLVLIAGNKNSIKSAIRKNRKLANDVAHGEIMHNDEIDADAKEIFDMAKKLSIAA